MGPCGNGGWKDEKKQTFAHFPVYVQAAHGDCAGNLLIATKREKERRL